ncbi:protocadherin Fat 1 [Elysia marginata]|uniref:Protocadherin Fat 1 n=1 Tax=Elysia marginata TaxID=1093978 RepID=A0AAV4GJE3_9GAST|nr:protocadherin Fat 1 [Elysia marginata]
MLCESQVKASVWARDPYNSAVGPFTVDINVDNYNERPSVTNLDTTVTINENENVDKRVLEFNVVDGKLTDHNYNQRSATSAGMEAYKMRAPSLRTRISLNYEREDTRSVKLYFDLDDGYCRSETYSLTVNVLDVPEEPQYTHTYMLIMTDEGQINEPNNVFVLDEDLNEQHTHAKETGTDDEFEVEATTGNIISVQDVLLVPVSSSRINTGGSHRAMK